MVKDDLEAFQIACDIYNETSSWKAIKTVFKRVSNPILYGAGSSFCVLIIFATCLAILIFYIANKEQEELLKYAVLSIVGVMLIIYISLFQKHRLSKSDIQPYRRLLTRTYYQDQRYFLFKEKLSKLYPESDYPFERVKSLTQSRLQLDQGLGAFKVWLLGITASVFVTIMFSLVPSGEGRKIYIAIISFFTLLALFYIYFIHNPYWFKNNKNRELILFLTLYEIELK